jgi:hypothetical protein
MLAISGKETQGYVVMDWKMEMKWNDISGATKNPRYIYGRN